ncbi:aldehyde dehydrogenase family protein [Porphyromonas levii]|uniref:aldehyde dehydrogenase family protein n=1 Tax=Porphyromonas levii TaxID=28114 RepID=UPI001B8B8E0C|nr:aldehyde dehydrogenase family protein [Porphyromonas levii]MBR8713621.1 Succinate-semialdehyde dehydrogenase (acetylating) [Porphyromonas levii]MBR8715379.1 Succinate-semialdehyde dehydrogenase (acetylating) [Porphyromonas levii]MBR8727897.1 Succinate-semialdehyde dehydrogenase (acetylating) [Porphyromonas levii]MBR8736242.1 Succinate-semialdehyde dehydrogenase (acetylating) [Porphyromonas levii]MBR8778270.1 Succinate-semialdehyde dehydrogenase (acetylating) [Porphyromonas levii]
MDIKEMVALARVAQQEFERKFDQQSTDHVVKELCKVVYDNAEMLAREAVDETGMGRYEDKVAKNRNKSKGVWSNLQGKKTMGVIGVEEGTGLMKIAKPVGVVCAITPTTNPIVTPMANIAFALKAKNAIIVSPHPRSKNCSGHTIELIKAKLKELKVPENLVQYLETPGLYETQELMSLVDVVVATGGMGMVHSAYSSGKPSFGVGAGNVQVIIDENINDFDEAADIIIRGRSFDNGIICSGEQCFIYPEKYKEEIFGAFKRNGAYFVPEEYHDQAVNTIFKNNAINRDVVGKDVEIIAKMIGIEIPEGTRILVVPAKGVATADLICKEKMCPVMTCLPYQHFDEAIAIANENLNMEGSGHSAGIHSNNQGNIIKAGNDIKVSRLIVNAPCSITAGGSIQNGLSVTTTLGCGSWGNNSISENLTYKHLMNITRIARMSTTITVPTDEEIWAMN